VNRIARVNFAVVPVVLTAILAHLACPACWPLFAGLVSWMGLSFLLSEKYLPPLTAVCLALAMAALGYSAFRQRRYGPLLLAMVGAALIVAGIFVLDAIAVTLCGAVVLVTSFVWNSRPRANGATACAPCANSPSMKVECSDAITNP
jgi:mercuric ion transport protein